MKKYNISNKYKKGPGICRKLLSKFDEEIEVENAYFYQY